MEVREENYAAILHELEPKINACSMVWARKLYTDSDDVKSRIMELLLVSIKTWDESKGKDTTFTNYFWTVAKNRLKNDVMHIHRQSHMFPGAAVELDTAINVSDGEDIELIVSNKELVKKIQDRFPGYNWLTDGLLKGLDAEEIALERNLSKQRVWQHIESLRKKIRESDLVT